jgi:hypothetical protein
MKWLKRWKTQTLLLTAISQGFSTANVDIDANGIFRHSFVRAHCRPILFWKTLCGVNRRSISHGFRPAFFHTVGES